MYLNVCVRVYISFCTFDYKIPPKGRGQAGFFMQIMKFIRPASSFKAYPSASASKRYCPNALEF